MDLVREGRLYVLSKLDRGAFINVHYVEQSLLFKVSLALVGLFTLIFLYILHRRKINQAQFLVVSGIAALLIRISLPQGFKHFASLLLLGIALSAVVLLSLSLYHRIQSRRDHEKGDESGSVGR